MMIESGGSATVVGPGGYYGLFQYAPSTWKGSWNPWRSSSIADGAAQIKATALALRQGYGHTSVGPLVHLGVPRQMSPHVLRCGPQALGCQALTPRIERKRSPGAGGAAQNAVDSVRLCSKVLGFV